MNVHRRRQHTMRRDLEERSDWLHLAKRRLLTLDAALANATSASQGRSGAITMLAGERTVLEDERTAKLAAYTGLLDDYAAVSRAAAAVDAERVLRDGLAPDARAAEERARSAVATPHNAADGARPALKR